MLVAQSPRDCVNQFIPTTLPSASRFWINIVGSDGALELACAEEKISLLQLCFFYEKET